MAGFLLPMLYLIFSSFAQQPLTKLSAIVYGVQLFIKIMRPSLNRTTEIKARCTERVKEQLARKLISIGYSRSYGNVVNPDLVNFMEALSDKPLEWFQENFAKVVDNPR